MGCIRSFQIKGLPTPELVAMAPIKDCPLLSAYQADRQVLWHRAWQLLKCNKDSRENVVALITGVNDRGLTSRCVGLPLFIPFGQVDRGRDRSRLITAQVRLRGVWVPGARDAHAKPRAFSRPGATRASLAR